MSKDGYSISGAAHAPYRLLSPGRCDSRYVDAHHIKHWADGGETSLENLVTLCRAHHRQLHQRDFTITAQKTATGQHLVFSTRSGKKIQASVFPQFPDVSAETSSYALRSPAVDAKTCIPHWHGEDCDYGMAIAALLQRDKAGGHLVSSDEERSPASCIKTSLAWLRLCAISGRLITLKAATPRRSLESLGGIDSG